MTQAPTTEAKNPGAWHHRPHEQELLRDMCALPTAPGAEMKGVWLKASVYRKSLIMLHFKRQVEAEMLWRCDVCTARCGFLTSDIVVVKLCQRDMQNACYAGLLTRYILTDSVVPALRGGKEKSHHIMQTKYSTCTLGFCPEHEGCSITILFSKDTT